MIFQPVYAKNEPSGLLFAYVEPMEPAPGRISRSMANGKVRQLKDTDIKMYRLQRSLDLDGTRKGIIINVTDIWRSVDLIPVFGGSCPEHWTSSTSMDLSKEFLVNRFFDKQSFIDIY